MKLKQICRASYDIFSLKTKIPIRIRQMNSNTYGPGSATLILSVSNCVHHVPPRHYPPALQMSPRVDIKMEPTNIFLLLLSGRNWRLFDQQARVCQPGCQGDEEQSQGKVEQKIPYHRSLCICTEEKIQKMGKKQFYNGGKNIIFLKAWEEKYNFLLKIKTQQN